MSSPRGLHALARLHGIQTAYHDHAGRRVGASAESLMAALRALGVPVREAADIEPALDRRRRALWERVVEPVVVAWLPDPDPFTVRLPDRLRSARVRLEVALEEGGVRTADHRAGELTVTDRAELAGRSYAAYEMALPAVPAGYHDLHVVVEGAGAPIRHAARLLAAPRRCAGWEGLPGGPDWGVFAPLHALHTADAPDRIPDFSLLDRLAESVAEHGGSVVGTLPLLAAFLDQPYEPSPYLPVSRRFWNELYVADPDATIGNGGSVDADRIDYRAAQAERRERLSAAAVAFFKEHTSPDGEDDGSAASPGPHAPFRALARIPELAGFLARNPGVADYARFRALTERHGAWGHWPDRLRARDVRPGDYDPERARYHLYAQWQAERQLAEVEERAASRGVSLYLDLPLGVHPQGYDTWRDRDQFALGATVGAPPDPLAPEGQEWGFHPPHPETSRLDGHRCFIEAIRAHLRFARVLRIDHVMQLHRLFWVPAGDAREGVYVRYPHEELYAILSLESHRKGAVIVGEDLGTVPRTVRRGMRRHGLPGMYVTQFELREDAKGRGGEEALVPGPIPSGALASIGTHDTPMFAAWWTGRDAEIRGERGLLEPGEVEAQVAGRRDLRDKLMRGFDFDFDSELGAASSLAAASTGAASLLRDPAERATAFAAQAALYRVLGRSEAGLVLASLEDLWLETEPQNVPGTPAEENWRRRARRPVEAMQDRGAAELLRSLNDAREWRP